MGDYSGAWLIYLVCAGICFAGIVAISWNWWGVVRDAVRVGTVGLLFIPAQVVGYPEHYAPAVVVALFEAVFQENGDPAPALARLIMVMTVLVVIVILLRLVRFLMRRRHETGSPANAS